MCLRDIKIEGLDKASFGCFAQQIMALCQYYSGEYWKLFVGNKLAASNGASSDSVDLITLDKNYVKAAQKYYGIYMVEDDGDMDFSNHTIYVITMHMKDYPLSTDSFFGDAIHHVLIYSENAEDYIIHDTFCSQTEYHMSKEYIHQHMIKKYRVQRKECSYDEQEVEREIERLYTRPFYDQWIPFVEAFPTMDRKDPEELIRCIQKISEYIDTNAQVFHAIAEDQTCTRVCAKILGRLSYKIKKIMYNFMKQYIKTETISDEYVQERLEKITDYLTIEKKIKMEVENLRTGQPSCMDSLQSLLIEFFEDPMEDNQTLVELGIGGTTLIALASYIEMSYGIEDIDVEQLPAHGTYLDLVLALYHILLHNID